MFSARNQFWFQSPTSNFGNNSLWPGSGSTTTGQSLIYSPVTTELIDWRATTGFTIEYWIRYATAPFAGAGGTNAGPGNHNGSTSNFWSFGPISTGQLQFYFWTGSNNVITTDVGILGVNTWYNVCMVATTTGSDTTVSFYVNGIRIPIRLGTSGSFSDTVTVSGALISTSTGFRMGRYGNNTAFWRNLTYMDNLRVSNIARYSGSSYTLATQPFTSDANTQLLVICDGTPGSTSFPDSSSFNRTPTNQNNRVTVSSATANHS